MARKKKEKMKSLVIKDVKASKSKKIVEDRHGNKFDLDKLSHRDLIEIIQEDK